MTTTTLERSSGRVTVKVHQLADEDPDYSYLGEWTNYARAPRNGALYSVQLDAVRLPDSDTWRDRRGRIVGGTDDTYARSFRFIALAGEYDGLPHRLRYYFQDADRLRGLDRGDWYYVGLVATVFIGDRQLGTASCWGYESDSNRRYLDGQTRELALEAIRDARAFLATLGAK